MTIFKKLYENDLQSMIIVHDGKIVEFSDSSIIIRNNNLANSFKHALANKENFKYGNFVYKKGELDEVAEYLEKSKLIKLLEEIANLK